ncbi:MAG: VCBS repeat-containing protein, partial [Thermoanaerobaculales bacterium]|nr:VCBS repeat-containing protein [Thermoanaerobaculales bacterium]
MLSSPFTREAMPLLVAVGVTLVGCGAQSSVMRTGEDPYRDSESAGEVLFIDVSKEVGPDLSGPVFAMAAADVEGDGWLDIVFTNHHGIGLLNNHHGSFQFTPNLLHPFEEDTHGMSWLDFDRDGRLDLLVTVGADRGFGGGGNLLMLGEGQGAASFRLSTALPEVLTDVRGRGRCVTLADFNRDGWLDIALMNAVQEDRVNRLAGGRAQGFDDWSTSFGLDHIRAEGLVGVYLSVDGPPVFVAYGAGADGGKIFCFAEDTGFHDCSSALGLVKPSSSVQAVVPGDYDNDGDLDLYFVRG